MSAPVVLFVYKRLDHLKKTLESLENCLGVEQTALYIFADGYKGQNDKKGVMEVHDFLRGYSGDKFKSVEIEYSPKNKGLANSIISGVSRIISEYGKVIVLEDDLILSRDFIICMNACLDKYKDNPKIGAISGYSLPISIPEDYNSNVYLSGTGNSWGWATWENVWNCVDWNVSDYFAFTKDRKKRKQFDERQYGISRMLDMQMRGEIDSWAVRWDYHFYKNDLCTLYPRRTKVINGGFGEGASHCVGDGTRFQGFFCEEEWNDLPERIDVRDKINRETSRFYKTSISERIIDLICKIKQRTCK